MHIAVSGNIGSGKTTLTRMLAKAYGWTPYFETGDNPYLADYYADMPRWSFNTQVHFLSKRLRDASEIGRTGGYVIQDRTIYEDAHVFARNLRQRQLMSQRDYDCYVQLFNLLTDRLPLPDLLIYLRGSVATLAKRIQQRGRSYEQGISLGYLQGLGDLYEEWIAHYPGKHIIIDVDRYQFALSSKDFLSVTEQIDGILFGLF
ncbi:MAG: deoxynucleoside kinase [Prevotella sp.]|nr:deoxynucleoside kinase [Prevotella sp.]